MSSKTVWPPVGSGVAHRGACGTHPENTLVGCAEALRQGAGIIEIDLQRSADGELMVVHDSTVRRTSDISTVLPDRADCRIGELTLAELRKLDAGSWFDERFRGAGIPTLAELLDMLAGRATLLIELKWPERSPGIEEQVVKELHRCLGAALDGPDTPVAIQVTDLERLRYFRDALPTAVPMCLMSGLVDPLPLEVFEDLGNWVSCYVPLGRVLQPGYVERVHQYDVRVCPWTIDAPEMLGTMRDMGADAVVTNHMFVAEAVLGGGPNPLPRTSIRIDSVAATEERAVLRNVGDAPVDLDGWWLRNQLSARQWLPATTVAPGQTVEIASEQEKFLDNYGDTLAVFDPAYSVVDLHFYR
ncbi:MAG: glycerophosphodiester phosphodiesterase family protein [Actinocatenispora sp.]